MRIETDSPTILGDKARLTQIVTTLKEHVSAGAITAAQSDAGLYDFHGNLILAIAEGHAWSADHEAAAQVLDLNGDHASVLGARSLTVSVMVIIELLKSHGGQLTDSQSGSRSVPIMKIVLPRVQ